MKKSAITPLLVTIVLTGCSGSVNAGLNNKTKQDALLPEIIVNNSNIDKAPGDCAHARLIHFDRLEPTYMKPGHIAFYFCLDCQKSFYDYQCLHEIPNSNLGIKNKIDGRYLPPLTKSLNILAGNIKAYLSAETEEEIITALENTSSSNAQLANRINFSGNNGPYTIEVSDTRDFASYKAYVSEGTAFTFERVLIPGQTFYYRIKDASNKIIHDDLSCRVDDSSPLRTLYVDGVDNVRDLGGWRTIDGKKIAYGKVFRGAKLNNITSKGIDTFLGTLGIKTEIDVRRHEDGEGGEATLSLLDPRLTYYECGMWQYTSIIPDYELNLVLPSRKEGVPPKMATIGFREYNRAGIKAFFEKLADPSNYPIYYHCSAGADRTGTISYLLSGLLGVPYEDLARDYELTSFSNQGARWRDDANEEGTGFTGNGIHLLYFDKGGDDFDYDIHQFGKMHEIIFARYSGEDRKLSTAIENFLKTECNITDETIAAVRANLLED